MLRTCDRHWLKSLEINYMKKKNIFGLMVVMCFVAQQVEAAERFRIKTHGGSGDGDGSYNWIFYLIFAIAILGGLYHYMAELKSLLRSVFGGFLLDEKTTLNKDQQRKLLLSGIYSSSLKLYMNSLKSDMTWQERKDCLQNDWQINDRDSALSVLTELKVLCTKSNIPHIAEAFKLNDQQAIDKYLSDTFMVDKDARSCAKEIENAFKAMPTLVKYGIVKDHNELVRIGTDGWNLTRFAFIVRLCYDSEYINEAEFWEFMDVADELAHRSLTSWEDYGKSYLIGYALWGTSNVELKIESDKIKKLTTDPKSPWVTFSFAK